MQIKMYEKMCDKEEEEENNVMKYFGYFCFVINLTIILLLFIGSITMNCDSNSCTVNYFTMYGYLLSPIAIMFNNYYFLIKFCFQK